MFLQRKRYLERTVFAQKEFTIQLVMSKGLKKLLVELLADELEISIKSFHLTSSEHTARNTAANHLYSVVSMDLSKAFYTIPHNLLIATGSLIFLDCQNSIALWQSTMLCRFHY